MLGDSVALEQMFAKLVHNAVKFTPAHGRITVQAGQRDAEIAV
jgi:signal transduction histidine kinase